LGETARKVEGKVSNLAASETGCRKCYKRRKSFLQGPFVPQDKLKPVENTAVYVGAKAPTS
jgi:hypothetical protein